MSEKWWDMSDDELDDLFRDASDKVDVPFESSSFDKLRQKIDIQRKPEPPQGYKSRWLVLLAGLFLIVGVGLVYHSVNKKQSLVIDSKGNNSTEIVGNVEKKNTVKPSNSSSSVSSEKSLKEEKQKESNSLKPENLPNNSANLSEQKKQLTEESNSLLSVSPQVAEKTNVEPPSESTNAKIKETKVSDSQLSSVGNIEKRGQAKVEINFDRSGTNSNTKTNKNSVISNSSPAETDLANNQLIKEGELKINNNNSYKSDNQVVVAKGSKNSKVRIRKNATSNPMVLRQNTPSILENSVIISEEIAPKETVDRTNFYGVTDLKNKDSKSLLTDIQPELPNYVDSIPRTIKPVRFSRLGLRFVLSPDMNSIENLGKTALGGSVGLLFEYKITKRLTIQTGLVYSNKSYVGSFDDYHNWKEWKGYHPSKPTEVDGGCTVFDIPINLRVNLFQKPKQTWFVNSGISSYWMMNESYTYLYAWSPPKAVDWNDNSKYYFSVLNFSIGLDRQISKHFSIQVEPYLKTPLKNVGRGGVNLYSSGVLFSTKYAF